MSSVLLLLLSFKDYKGSYIKKIRQNRSYKDYKSVLIAILTTGHYKLS